MSSRVIFYLIDTRVMTVKNFCQDALDIAVGKEKSFKEFFGAVRAMTREDVASVANTPQVNIYVYSYAYSYICH